MSAVPLPEPAFRLKWKHGEYKVDRPDIDDTDCYTADQLRAYADAVRSEERERAAQICTAAMPNPVMNWCDAQIVEALRQCAEIIRNYRAQDNAEVTGRPGLPGLSG